MQEDNSLRQEFFQLKSSIHQRRLQLAGDKRRATRICKSVEKGDSRPPLLQLLHIAKHKRSDGIQSDSTNILPFYNLVDSLQKLSKVRDISRGSAVWRQTAAFYSSSSQTAGIDE